MSRTFKGAAVYFAFGFSYIIYITFFVAHLTTEGALTPQKAGQIFAVLGLLSIFGGAVWGWISDVLGRRIGSLLAYLFISLSFVIIASSRSTTGFYVSSIIFGISLSSIPAIMAAAVGDSVGGRLAPAALGFITLIFGILRKELAIIMLVQALGTSNFSSVMTEEQMMVFTVFSLFYIPCLATLGMLRATIGGRGMLFTLFFTTAIGTGMALAVRALYWAY